MEIDNHWLPFNTIKLRISEQLIGYVVIIANYYTYWILSFLVVDKIPYLFLLFQNFLVFFNIYYSFIVSFLIHMLNRAHSLVNQEPDVKQ